MQSGVSMYSSRPTVAIRGRLSGTIGSAVRCQRRPHSLAIALAVQSGAVADRSVPSPRRRPGGSVGTHHEPQQTT